MYKDVFPGVTARDCLDIAEIDSVIFEVNDVLVDISDSLPRAAVIAVRQYLEGCLGWGDGDLLQHEDIRLLRRAGGFSEYMDITAVTVLFYLYKEAVSGGHDRERLLASSPTLSEFAEKIRHKGGNGMETAISLTIDRLEGDLRTSISRQWNLLLAGRLFQEIYAGSDRCREIYGRMPQFFKGPGTIENERPILRAGRLDGVGRRFGLFSGRTRGEMQAALKLLDIGSWFCDRTVLTLEDGKKPDPTALGRLAEILNSDSPLYVGSTLDDLRTVENLRKTGGRAFCAILLTASGGRNDCARFKHLGADLIAEDINALLSFMRTTPRSR